MESRQLWRRVGMSRINFRHGHKLQSAARKSNFRNTLVLFLCLSLFLPALAIAQTRNLEILVPAGVVNQTDYSSNVSAMIADTTVTGATITVYWSDFQTANNTFDWSITDAAFQPWEDKNGVPNHKKINIVLQMISNAFQTTCPTTGIGSRGVASVGGVSTGNCAMPPWVWTMLGSSNYTVCGDTTNTIQMFPNYFSSSFQDAYQNAVAHLIDHYANTLSQFSGDYIRVALGHGGEMLPSPQWSSNSTCLSKLENWIAPGTDEPTFISDWNTNWLTPMTQFMGGSNFNGAKTPIRIMGAITPMGTDANCSGCEVPDSIAPIYVEYGMGFGTQGFEISDVGSIHGTADWVGLFTQEDQAMVPLELQTLGQSCPGGVGKCDSGMINCTVNNMNYINQSLAGCTGDLPTLLTFAEANHATILEIYYQDWDLANVSSYCTFPGGQGATTRYCYSDIDKVTGQTYGQLTKSALNGWAWPDLISISPPSIRPGTVLTLTGFGFGTQADAVSFGPLEATTFTSWTDTQIVLTVPQGLLPGSVMVDQNGVQSNAIAYTVTPPVLTSISPPSIRPGTAVTLNGSGFGTQADAVSFGPLEATTFTSWSDTQIKLTVPQGLLPGSVMVDQDGVQSNAIAYTVTPPVLNSISQTSITPGTVLTLNGTGFGSQADAVSFGPLETTTFTSWTNTKIVVTVPQGVQAGSVMVDQNGVQSNGIAYTVH